MSVCLSGYGNYIGGDHIGGEYIDRDCRGGGITNYIVRIYSYGLHWNYQRSGSDLLVYI